MQRSVMNELICSYTFYRLFAYFWRVNFMISDIIYRCSALYIVQVIFVDSYMAN